MRKISILQESYMALEQKIAEAIDGAESKIETSYGGMAQQLEEVCSQVEDKENFHKDPIFINFKNEINIAGMAGQVDAQLSKMALDFKSVSSVSLDMAAYLSKVYEMLSSQEIEHEDEVAEVVMFFGPKENTNIPDAEAEDFVVTLSDAAKSEVIQKMIQMRSAFEKLKETVMSALSNGKIMEEFKEAMKQLAILEDLTSEFNGKDLN
jgi:hypothetical protein